MQRTVFTLMTCFYCSLSLSKDEDKGNWQNNKVLAILFFHGGGSAFILISAWL